MNDLLDKFKPFEAQISSAIDACGINPLAVRMESIESPTRAIIAGKPTILLGTNNYLGLTFNDEALAIATETLAASGTGSTGSRVANGNYTIHEALEKQLAAFYDKKHAILFTTGYQANVGFISAIAGQDDYLLIDADSHASIYDGCKLGNATVIRFKHNDAADLDKRLARLPAGRNKLLIVEGIYSMIGDKAPLSEMTEVAKKHGCYVMVDEAHSLGVLGEKGRGLVEEAGLEDDVDFIIGTFSKSVGTIGGFCVSNHDAMDALRVTARSYIFTASLPPSVVAAAAVNLRHIEEKPELRRALWRNADQLYSGLIALGFKVGPEKTPVIGIQMPSVEEGLHFWKQLLAHGVYVNLALPPATPTNFCLLRCSVCALHTEEEINTVLSVFGKLRQQFEQAA
ncbi:MAG: aminotransferase class I/II-fold pyridoxal phosphate-dependent enzyme [Rickettsiales bacterium]|nr:aminotransferase class I/II-fold pyridoxal phosphate-dependent enzyme [Rickettsiales bacterium]